MKKTLRWKIIYINEVYKFSVGLLYIFYVLILNIDNKKFHVVTKICEIQNKR